jgi:hypothetical protein
MRVLFANVATAKDVWIWLGEANHNSDAAMNYIRKIRAINFDDPKYSDMQVVPVFYFFAEKHRKSIFYPQNHHFSMESHNANEIPLYNCMIT